MARGKKTEVSSDTQVDLAAANVDYQAVKTALAADEGPMTMTVAINRVTGKVTVSMSRVADYDASRIMVSALMQITQQLNDQLLKMAEDKGKQSVAKANDA